MYHLLNFKVAFSMQKVLCCLALILCTASFADGFRIGVGLTNDHVDTQFDLALAEPLDGGPSWRAFVVEDQDSTNAPGLAIELGYLFSAPWQWWAEPSIEYSFAFKDSGSNRFTGASAIDAGEPWSLGRYSSLMFSYKIGNDHLQWNISRRTATPYFGISLGRTKNEFGVSGLPGTSPYTAYGDTGMAGIGVLIGDAKKKRTLDVSLYWELYRLSRNVDFPELSDVEFISYYFQVTQWKMNVSYSFSL